MRIDSLIMMIVICLVLGEKVNRAFGPGAYWFNGRGKGDAAREDAERFIVEDCNAGKYLKKLVNEYKLIPLMSKLI